MGASLNALRPGMAHVIAGDTAGGGGRFPVADVHTFLEYDIVFVGGRFHVRIFPFANAHGDYVVISANNITAPHTSSGRDVLFIPLEPAATSEIQIRFTPSMPGMSPLYSQVMVFTPVSDRHIFTEPANFILHPDNPPLTFLEPSNLNEAIFSVDVGWDLATIQQLENYFDEVNLGRGPGNTFGPDSPNWNPPLGTVPPGWTYPSSVPRGAIRPDATLQEWYLPQDELIFSYLLHSRLNPFDTEGTPFVWVHVTVSRVNDPVHGWQFEWDYVLEEIITPPMFQVLAPPPPTTALPVPTSIFVTKTSATQYTAQVVNQFGQPYTASAPVITWDIGNVSGGTATIDENTGAVTVSAPGVSYTVMARAVFDQYGINITRSVVVTNPTVAPTSLTINSADRVYQDHAMTFTPTFTPANALNSVRWEVTNMAGQTVPGATISQNGVLFVSRDVPAETMLRVRAIANSMGSGNVIAQEDNIRVVVPERRHAISNVTMGDTLRIGVGPGGVAGGGIRLNMIASRMGITVPPLPHFFNFPEIYHITAQLIDINANDNRDEPITPPLPESNSQPMTLDAPADPTFPPPQNLRAWVNENDEDDDDIIGGYFDMAFDMPLGRMRHYVTSSPRYGADVDVTVRVFIGQDQDAVQNIAGLEGAARAGAATRINVAATVSGVHQILEPFSDSGNLDALRAAPVVYFDMEVPGAVLFSDRETLEQTLKLHGLDRNQQYFITLDAFIDWDVMPVFTDYSTTTNIAGVTTMGDLIPPDPGAMRPPRPEDLRLDDVTVSSATISWLPVPPLTPTGGEIRYQVLRMRADQLPNELLDRRDYSMTGSFRN